MVVKRAKTEIIKIAKEEFEKLLNADRLVIQCDDGTESCIIFHNDDCQV